jgi:hypothetical protein
MRFRFSAFSLLLAVAIGCSSAKPPAGFARPEIAVQQLGSVFFGSGSTAPVTVAVGITNHAHEPIVIRRIRIETPGMMEYALYPVERLVNETIQAGDSRTVSISGTAVASRSRLTPREPLNARVQVDYTVNGKNYREIVFQSNIANY